MLIACSMLLREHLRRQSLELCEPRQPGQLLKLAFGIAVELGGDAKYVSS